MGYLFLSILFSTIQGLITIPVAILNILIVDFLKRYAVDPVKMFLSGVVGTILVIAYMNPDWIILTNLAIGGATLKATGGLFIAGILVAIQILTVFFVYTLLIYIYSPNHIKKYARLTLLGGTVYGLLPAIFYASNLTAILPGCMGIFLTIGFFLSGLSFKMCPELHEVLVRKSDIAKARYLQERFFFHDFMNTISIIKSSVEILDEYSNLVDREQYLTAIQSGIDNLIQEIQIQQEIRLAEQGQLVVNLVTIESVPFLRDLKESFSAMAVMQNKTIVIDAKSDDCSLVSDFTILRRILSNMIKNALEAIRPDESITIGCSIENSSSNPLIWVHNSGVIPEEIQMRIFKDLAVSKGARRGLGTYSMKLLSRYINCNVGFTSTDTYGTKFFIQIHPSEY